MRNTKANRIALAAARVTIAATVARTARAASCPWNTPDCGCDGTLYNPMGTAHSLSPTTKHTTRHTCGLAVPVVGHVAQCGSCNEIGHLDGKVWTWTRGGLDVDFARG